MKNATNAIFTEDPWCKLRSLVDARIGLGRCGSSLPLHEFLKFKLDHARARDAVVRPFEKEEFIHHLTEAGIPCLSLASRVRDRVEYLTRPDLGRRLNDASKAFLEAQPKCYDVCFVVSDGLSSRAIHENGLAFITKFMKLFGLTSRSAAPVCVVENGRVAIADEIAEILDCKLAVLCIGERPGLSSPNSMGIYMTYSPKVGTTDEARNCISNIRDGGMTLDAGVQKLAYLVEAAFSHQTSGVMLKDTMTKDYLPFGIDMTALDERTI